jgi:hypothetical protein
MVNAANGVPLPPGAIPAPPGGFPSIADPGPSSHPRGPPNLGQLSQIAMQAQAAAAAAAAGVGAVPPPPPGGEQDEDDSDEKKDKPAGASGRRGGRGGAAMGSEEWARQRKDNHVRFFRVLILLLLNILFLCSLRTYRKKSNVVVAVTSMKASTNSAESFLPVQARKPKAPSSPVPCNTSTILKRTKLGI